MDAKDFHTTLYRIDPSKNMARFYSLSIQPNLFGGQSLIRSWGRVGSSGQMKVELYEDRNLARIALANHFRLKTRKGYNCQAGIHISDCEDYMLANNRRYLVLEFLQDL